MHHKTIMFFKSSIIGHVKIDHAKINYIGTPKCYTIPIFMLDRNVDINCSRSPGLRERLKVGKLSWGDTDEIAALEPPFEVIICSDVT